MPHSSKHVLPVISKRFADVAAYLILEMQKQLDAGLGKKSYRDYIIALNHYPILCFGDNFETPINYEKLQRFVNWRADKMGRAPMASTPNTHNSALNEAFDEAVVTAI